MGDIEKGDGRDAEATQERRARWWWCIEGHPGPGVRADGRGLDLP